MEPGAKKDTRRLAYGLPAFVFLSAGVVLYLNGTPALICAASVIMGLIFVWMALRTS